MLGVLALPPLRQMLCLPRRAALAVDVKMSGEDGTSCVAALWVRLGLLPHTVRAVVGLVPVCGLARLATLVVFLNLSGPDVGGLVAGRAGRW